jgi:hypothetical protein
LKWRSREKSIETYLHTQAPVVYYPRKLIRTGSGKDLEKAVKSADVDKVHPIIDLDVMAILMDRINKLEVKLGQQG